MPGRLLVLCLAVYACLDFANPLMPGAVSFEADTSVEGVQIARHAGPIASASSLPALRVTLLSRPDRLTVPRPRTVPAETTFPPPKRFCTERGLDPLADGE